MQKKQVEIPLSLKERIRAASDESALNPGPFTISKCCQEIKTLEHKKYNSKWIQIEILNFKNLADILIRPKFDYVSLMNDSCLD